MAIPPPARGARGPARFKSGDALREGLFKLFARSYRRAEKTQVGAGRAVYRSAARMIHELCGQPWAQATIFPEETRLAQRFQQETGLAAGAPGAFVQQALMTNCWAPAWTEILLAAPHDEFLAYCVVKGEEELRAALAGKRGVILAHAHTVFAQLFWRWLEHREIPAGITLWQWSWNRSREEKEDPKLRAIESAKEMHAASHLLRDGGLVHSLADGRWGGDRAPVPFHRRMRVFQPSFAELAVMTGAPVLPADVILQVDGRLRIDIGARFSEADAAASRSEKVDHLMREYVRHLAGRWRRHAGNLEWFQMNRHLTSPRLAKKEQ